MSLRAEYVFHERQWALLHARDNARACPVIIATMEDSKRSKQVADEKGWEMYSSDLADQITGMEQVLVEL